ncbi:hypothetical protein B0H16DRAFT_1459566 [Mycena metata]|uniref:Uncharacterized protein n=1 Tax=Mycena metata TaxID=1033252 RepID=A0AAD7J1N6_9AGAR|nr:hypothetical protein B0H16DRAFT_1459566 [Mycena metata]
MSSTFDDSAYVLPLYHSPRRLPLPPQGSAPSGPLPSPPPDGFVIPRIPPPDCPLRVTRDSRGHRQLPHVSDHPLPVDHERVIRLVKSRVDVVAKCANCAELAIPCEFSESGIPCPPCAVLGIPDCDYSDPYFFVANLAYHRDAYLHEERSVLVDAVKQNFLEPSQFSREYERANAWYYSAAQGAITRFLINCHATGDLAFRGYQCIAEASNDAGLLSRFLAIGHESGMHPSVLQTVAGRLQGLFNTFLGEE